MWFQNYNKKSCMLRLASVITSAARHCNQKGHFTSGWRALQQHQTTGLIHQSFIQLLLLACIPCPCAHVLMRSRLVDRPVAASRFQQRRAAPTHSAAKHGEASLACKCGCSAHSPRGRLQKHMTTLLSSLPRRLSSPWRR